MTGSSRHVWAVAAGVALGLAYAASPATIWFLALLAVVFWWIGRDLSGRERRFIWGMLAIAVAVRLAAIAVLFLASAHDRPASFFWDGDGVYVKRRAAWILESWSGIPLHPSIAGEAFQHSYGWSTYIYLLAYVQYLLGPAPYGVHLVGVLLFVAGSAVLYRTARATYGAEAAGLGLALTIFLPTLVSWSVSALKESLYLFLGAITVAATMAAVRSPRALARITAAAVAAVTVIANNTVRVGALEMSLAGIAGGLGSHVFRHRPRLLAALGVLAVLVGAGLWNGHAVPEQVMSGLRRAANVHVGYVRSGGNVYYLLDRHLYEGMASTRMTPAEGARFAARAIASIVVIPLPWHARSRSEAAFIPQQIAWYALVLFSVLGFVNGMRRDAAFTGSLAGIVAVGAAMIAFTNGNIGSMVRLRDMLIPYLVWMSSLGAITSASWFAPRLPRVASSRLVDASSCV